MDETNLWGYSHGAIITRALVHTALWWPCWWLSEWVRDLGMWGLGTTVAKLIFYINNFYMVMFWFFIYSIAKGDNPSRREIVKYLFFWLIIHVIMEIPVLFYPN